jgi:hypothetical protein
MTRFDGEFVKLVAAISRSAATEKRVIPSSVGYLAITTDKSDMTSHIRNSFAASVLLAARLRAERI